MVGMIGVAGAGAFGSSDAQRRCSFCGRREAAVAHLVRSRGVHICEGCIAEAQAAVASAPAGTKLLRIKPRPARVADREAAEQAIERAFETAFSAELPDAERCAAIERGSNLAATMQEVRDRYSPARDLDVTVEYVRFVSEDEAEVHFTLLLSPPGPSALSRTGHAVRADEQWLVSRSTWCELIAAVGVECPPPEHLTPA
jgi:hypothetical protein